MHSATGTGYLSVGMSLVVGKPSFQAFIRKALLSQDQKQESSNSLGYVYVRLHNFTY